MVTFSFCNRIDFFTNSLIDMRLNRRCLFYSYFIEETSSFYTSFLWTVATTLRKYGEVRLLKEAKEEIPCEVVYAAVKRWVILVAYLLN